MSHDHDHDQEGGHHPEPPSDLEARTLALQSVLEDKGVFTAQDLDRIVSTYEHDVGPMIGARVVAHAWVDSAFKQRLLQDPARAIAELGVASMPVGELRVVENIPEVHNMVVCTLCSCYPWAVLGLPPTWYKSAPYRSRAVSEPRQVLMEFGLSLPESIGVNVWDSSSDLRYMVLPQRPEDSEDLSEEELAALVTRDCMIGVARPQLPVGSPAGAD